VRKLVKVRDALWQGNGFGRAPAYYELRDDAGGTHGTLTCVGRCYSWRFQPNPLREEGRPRRFRTFREAHDELTRPV
jgi:hypothetical protein